MYGSKGSRIGQREVNFDTVAPGASAEPVEAG